MELNGVVNIWKPKGLTSHDVVSRVRRIAGMKRVGHTGTLDPMAEGVLPVCLGKATKAAYYITSSKKQYLAEMTLGIKTDTEDITGNILEQKEVCVSTEELKNATKEFLGEINQIPPMYSAVHFEGKRLYEIARKGITVERKPRKITVYNIEVQSFENNTAKLLIDCSKGTYIRTLCADIGDFLGSGATMSALVRTKSGIFAKENAVTLEEFEENPAEKIIPIDEFFCEFEKIYLTEKEEFKVRNGVPLKKALKQGTYRVYAENGEFLCLSCSDSETLKMKVSFY